MGDSGYTFGTVDATPCPFCGKMMIDRSNLPCNHSCCYKCYEKFTKEHLLAGTGSVVRCLLCEAGVAVPEFTTGSRSDEDLQSLSIADCPLSAVEHSGGHCSLHTNNLLDGFCMNCELAICLSCYHEGHTNHHVSNLDMIAKQFQRSIRMDMENCSQLIIQNQTKALMESQLMNCFNENLARIEREFRQKRDRLNQMLDEEFRSILNQFNVERMHRLADIESLRVRGLKLEHFRRDAEKIVKDAVSVKVVRAVPHLRQLICDSLLSDQ